MILVRNHAVKAIVVLSAHYTKETIFKALLRIQKRGQFPSTESLENADEIVWNLTAFDWKP